MGAGSDREPDLGSDRRLRPLDGRGAKHLHSCQLYNILVLFISFSLTGDNIASEAGLSTFTQDPVGNVRWQDYIYSSASDAAPSGAPRQKSRILAPRRINIARRYIHVRKTAAPPSAPYIAWRRESPAVINVPSC